MKNFLFFIGVLFIGLGLIMNEILLAVLFSEDGVLASSSRLMIWIFDGFSIGIGLLLVMSESLRTVLSKDLQKYLSYFFSLIIISLISLTSITTQSIAMEYAWVFSGSDLLSETVIGNKSLLSKSILFLGDINPSIISIIYSMIMSIVSVIGLMLYAYSYKMELPDICMFLCCLFFVDHLMVYYLDWQYGLNYPLYILKASWNTTGHIGFSFSILTIAAFINNYKFGVAALIFTLFIHPSLGLLTISYICLHYVLRKDYFRIILPVLIGLIFILFNYKNIPLERSFVIDYIYSIDVHRKAIDLIDLKFLLIPIVFTLLITNKKDLLTEWIFIISCLLVSYLYYNVKIELMNWEILALMPNRGVNIGVAIIIIKFCIDVIRKPEPKKLIVPLILLIIISFTGFYSNFFLLFIVGQLLLTIYLLFDVFIGFKNKPSAVWKVDKSIILVLLIGIISIHNFLQYNPNYKSRNYDEFFNSKESYILDFTGDTNIMVRNRGLIELLPMGQIDGYSYYLDGLVKANNIFSNLFKLNLWDLDVKIKCGCIKYCDIKHLIENFKEDDWQRAKMLKLEYIIAPIDSDLRLQKVWSDIETVIYKL